MPTIKEMPNGTVFKFKEGPAHGIKVGVNYIILRDSGNVTDLGRLVDQNVDVVTTVNKLTKAFNNLT